MGLNFLGYFGFGFISFGRNFQVQVRFSGLLGSGLEIFLKLAIFTNFLIEIFNFTKFWLLLYLDFDVF